MRVIARLALALLVLLPMILAGHQGTGSLAGAAPGDTAPQSYAIIDLGTLPGQPPTAVYGANALNGTGQVVGSAYSTARYTPFLYGGGVLSQLPTPGDIVEAEAQGINTGGQAVGWTWNGTGTSSFYSGHAALWQAGVLTDLHPAGSAGSGANAVNDTGQVVGYILGPTVNDYPHPARWTGGVPTDLTPPGEGYGIAYAINATGEIAGVSGRVPGESHATLWHGGTATNLGVPVGYSTSAAFAINATGQVVGYAIGGGDGLEVARAYLWQGGTATELGTLGGKTSYAYGINAVGQIVGWADTFGHGTHAALWQDGRAIDLNGRIPANSGWTLSTARAINDAGQIVGSGRHNGQLHAFLLTPTADPGRSMTLTLTSGPDGTAAVDPPGPTYPVGTVVTLTATPVPGSLFTGWTIDGAPAGWATPLALTLDVDRVITATFATQSSFADVPVGQPEANAVAQLAARGIVRGYGNGNFGPGDNLLRAQIAGLVVRAVDWEGETGPFGSTFTDQCGPQGCVDDALWADVYALRSFAVALGFGDGTFRPFDPVLPVQAISLFTRAMVVRGYWRNQTDDPALYPNVPANSGHRRDLATYVHYAGALPDAPTDQPLANWDSPATRAWVARMLWQGLDGYWGTDRVP